MVQSSLNDYLEDLNILYHDIDLEDPSFIVSLRTKEAKDYVKGLRISKPEAIASDKLLKPIMAEIGIDNFPEGRIGGGFVDFILPSSKEMGPPIALELKPLHLSDGTLNPLEREYKNLLDHFESSEMNRTNQITRYLMGREGVEYVVFTNLKDVMIFDRGCVIKFEPVKKESFREFAEGISSTKNIADYLRRSTEEIEKRDLDKHFFEDLKKWFQSLQKLEWVEDPQYNSVLLLNKLIFALTLEDFVIIDYRETWNTFVRNYNKWSTKGAKAVLTNFFRELDNFLYEYYDTELFVPSSDIISKLKDKRENYNNFLVILRTVAGFVEEPTIFSGGLYSYSFRLIDEDVFGKSYETFLAENRKDAGIYYTPKFITKSMASELVNELFSDIKNSLISDIKSNRLDDALRDAERLTNVTIIDPACGSGPFLISVLREISKVYNEIREETKWVEHSAGLLEMPDDIKERIERVSQIRKLLGLNENGGNGLNREALSKIILRHLYGIDLDNTALEVAKVNLWKETVKLNPASFHFQSLPETSNHILPNLNINFINGNSIVGLEDNRAIEILSGEFKENIVEMIRLRKEYIEDPSKAEIPAKIEGLKGPIRERLRREFEKAYGTLESRPLFYPLEFFFLYFDENGEALPQGKRGFSGAIGNPPWNNLKPNKKEFASKHPEIFGEGISKYSISGKDFEKIFDEKMRNEEVKELWKSYAGYYEWLSKYIKSAYTLHYSGDFSLQKVFLEKFMRIARDGFCILIPSNFHTDEGTYLLRKEILENWEIRKLISFENRGKVWFKDIDSRFKFDMLVISRLKTGRPFKARFYVTSVEDMEKTFDYPVNLISKISPEILGITEFRSERDIEVISAIRGNHRTLKELGFTFRREFDMTNDNVLFNTDGVGLPLYEGKMIHQYNSHYSEPTYYIDESIGRARLMPKEIKRIKIFLEEEGRKQGLQGEDLKNFIENNLKLAMDNFEKHEFKLDYESERLVYRAVASSTNERTLISSIIPAGTFAGNSLICLVPFDYKVENGIIGQIKVNDIFPFIMAIMNSFVADYYIRMQVSANLNMFFVYELPIPEVNKDVKDKVIEIVNNLMNNENIDLRAEIEVLIARDVFNLSKGDMKHILDSFVYGNVNEELKRKIMDNF